MKFKLLLILVLICAVCNTSYTQGVAQPLTIQGLENFSITNSRSQGMGGVSIGVPNQSASIFSNPAWIAETNSIEVLLGNNFIFKSFEQQQDWIPNELYAELSIIFENNELFRIKTFDNIKPNWFRRKRQILPSLVSSVIPVKILNQKLSFGLGISEHINLNHYFQNNNALAPNIGQMRPAPIPRPKAGDTVKVNWFQYINERTGSIYQITPAIAYNLFKNFNIGASLSILSGSSEDYELRRDRGFLKLTTATPSTGTSFNNITLDSVYFINTYNGTSNFKGFKTIYGFSYKSKFFNLGFTFTPKYKIERTYTKNFYEIKNDSLNVYDFSGKDKVVFPNTYNFGIALLPSKNLLVAIDFEVKNFSKVVYTPFSDTSYNPWLNCNNVKIGIEYNATGWLIVRTGYREERSTVAAEGAEILQNPLSGSAYSLGLGIRIDNSKIDLAYENIFMKYQDTWLSNINTNKIQTHKFFINFGYVF